MRIATWNLNNRVGTVTFRPEAANAAIAINADVLVFTEYYPQAHHLRFARVLEDAGWEHQLLSEETSESANHVFIAARCLLEPLNLDLPNFDLQFAPNLLGAIVPSFGVSLVGVRVPWYDSRQLVFSAWDWLAAAAASLKHCPAIILGDLNVSLTSDIARGGNHFRRVLESGWHRATPTGGASYYGRGDGRSEIDHILGTNLCEFGETEYIMKSGAFELAGAKHAISDHAALVTRVKALPEQLAQ